MSNYIDRKALLDAFCNENCNLNYDGTCHNCRSTEIIADFQASDASPALRWTYKERRFKLWWIEPTIATTALLGVFVAVIGYFTYYIMDLENKAFGFLLILGALLITFSLFAVFTLKIWESFM